MVCRGRLRAALPGERARARAGAGHVLPPPLHAPGLRRQRTFTGELVCRWLRNRLRSLFKILLRFVTIPTATLSTSISETRHKRR